MVTSPRPTDEQAVTQNLTSTLTPRDSGLLSPRGTLSGSNNSQTAVDRSTAAKNQKLKIKFRIPLVDIKFTSELNENDEILRLNHHQEKCRDP